MQKYVQLYFNKTKKKEKKTIQSNKTSTTKGIDDTANTVVIFTRKNIDVFEKRRRRKNKIQCAAEPKIVKPP